MRGACASVILITYQQRCRVTIDTYISGKYAIECIVFKEERFPSVIIRPFLVYGEGQNCNRFLPQVIKSCLNNEEFKVTKGEQLRDFLYVGDFAEAVNMCLGNKKTYGEIFNIASGKPVSIKYITELVKSFIGKGIPNYGARPYRKGENMELYADIRKSKEHAGET